MGHELKTFWIWYDVELHLLDGRITFSAPWALNSIVYILQIVDHKHCSPGLVITYAYNLAPWLFWAAIFYLNFLLETFSSSTQSVRRDNIHKL